MLSMHQLVHLEPVWLKEYIIVCSFSHVDDDDIPPPLTHMQVCAAMCTPFEAVGCNARPLAASVKLCMRPSSHWHSRKGLDVRNKNGKAGREKRGSAAITAGSNSPIYICNLNFHNGF
jgi:hypothetical protein